MSAEELEVLKQEIQGLKAALVKKDEEAGKVAENMDAVENELKKLLKQEKVDSTEPGT